MYKEPSKWMPLGNWCAIFVCGVFIELIFSIFYSGLCRPGMNAILGPTGSGKSS